MLTQPFSRIVVAALPLLLVAGCSSSSTSAASPAGTDAGSDADANTRDAGSDASVDASSVAYPAGPYGIAVGDVFPNVTLTGQVGGGSAGSVASQDYYDPTGSRGIRGLYITLTVSGGGCGPCLNAAKQVEAAYAGTPFDFATRGGRVLDVLLQSWTTVRLASTAGDIGAWTSATGATYDVAIDPQAPSDAGPLGSSFGAIDGVPISFVVDARTMKVTATFLGADTTAPNAVATAANLKAFDAVLVANGAPAAP